MGMNGDIFFLWIHHWGKHALYAYIPVPTVLYSKQAREGLVWFGLPGRVQAPRSISLCLINIEDITSQVANPYRGDIGDKSQNQGSSSSEDT